ncbi:MAG: hypothetical protein U0802_24245 [Candidatus Binatia bacterium]
MRHVTQRLVTAAAMVTAIWMFAAEHSDATMAQASHHQTTCHQIRAALESGKSMQAVEKELKVSSKHIRQCQQQKTSATANH